MSQDEVSPEAKISILVSPENVSLLLKAAKEISQRSSSQTETANDFERQNPASKQLMIEVNKVFDQAASNLAREIKELLSGNSE